MAFELGKNFQVSTVATAPSPAISGTSLVVASGDGAKFDTTPFNAIIAPVDAQPTSTNSEIVRVTAKSTDTFTITRATESSTARTVIVGDRIYVGPTAKTFSDIAGGLTLTQAASVQLSVLDAKGDLYAATGSDAVDNLPVGANQTHLVADSAQSMGVKWETSPDRDYGQAGMYATTHAFGTANTALTSDRFYCARFVPSRAMTITAISFNVATASGTNDAVEVGIAHATGASTLALDRTSGSTTATLNAASVKTVNLSSGIALTAGTTYYAFFTATSTASVTSISYPSTNSAHMFGSTLTTGAEAMIKASTAPGVSFPLASVSAAPATVPLLALKV